MNGRGSALVADSAVTLGDGQNIYGFQFAPRFPDLKHRRLHNATRDRCGVATKWMMHISPHPGNPSEPGDAGSGTAAPIWGVFGRRA